MREKLREDCHRPARVDIIGKKGEVLCRRGENPEMWMLHGCTEHKHELDDVHDALKEDSQLAHLWGPMTSEEKQAELNIKDTERCMIAPYIVRLALLDRLIAACATEMKQIPDRRQLVTDKEIDFKPRINECRWERGKDSTAENDDEAPTRPSRIAKRQREMPSLRWSSHYQHCRKEEEELAAYLTLLHQQSPLDRKRHPLLRASTESRLVDDQAKRRRFMVGLELQQQRLRDSQRRPLPSHDQDPERHGIRRQGQRERRSVPTRASQGRASRGRGRMVSIITSTIVIVADKLCRDAVIPSTPM